MKTLVISRQEAQKQRRWYVVDAEGQVLGRMATLIADVLQGKYNPRYAPHVDTGDFVIVINAGKVRLTGHKETKKIYYRHSGWVGGLKETTAGEMRKRNPTAIVALAVQRMLPKGTLGRQMFRKLKVYAESEHPHDAQQPQPWSLEVATHRGLEA